MEQGIRVYGQKKNTNTEICGKLEANIKPTLEGSAAYTMSCKDDGDRIRSGRKNLQDEAGTGNKSPKKMFKKTVK